MVVGGGGDVAGYTRAGFQEGRKVGSIQAGRLAASAVEGEGDGGGMEGAESIGIEENLKNGLKRGTTTAMGEGGVTIVNWKLGTIEITNKDR